LDKLEEVKPEAAQSPDEEVSLYFRTCHLYFMRQNLCFYNVWLDVSNFGEKCVKTVQNVKQ